MALAFVNSRDFLTSNIIGATNLEQLKENIESYNINLSSELLDQIERKLAMKIHFHVHDLFNFFLQNRWSK